MPRWALGFRLSVDLPEIEHRLYPIGTLSERDVVAIFTDPLCAEEVSIDNLLEEWRAKSRAFQTEPAPTLDALDSEFLPLAVLVETMKYEDIPNPMVEVSKERLFVPKPLTISTLRDGNVSRLFKWKKSKRVIKLMVNVTQETSYVP